MKKVRIIHFWIGVIVSLFLLIESTTGIILYFDKGGERPNITMQGQFPSDQMGENKQSDFQNEQTNGNGNNTTSNGQGTDNQQLPFQNGAPNFGENKVQQSAFSVKNLHTGIIGLISGIGLFILTGTGLVLSWFIWKNKRKSKMKNRKVTMAS
ncbi:PepSY domain-containing protein [Bacillus sp. EAC]|uniref:PepSY domain-containing protein n=1 Tax=Bacillus sp. EAC TaxID=1978338 RepID=UPI000B43563E|nr:PepSY domain-containing protein [Bacillus sp. EAC]